MRAMARNLGQFYTDLCFRRGLKALRRLLADPDDYDEQLQREALDDLAEGTLP